MCCMQVGCIAVTQVTGMLKHDLQILNPSRLVV